MFTTQWEHQRDSARQQALLHKANQPIEESIISLLLLQSKSIL
uniref:Uncharacterized protein n=1 Tax=Arundo donax TaxID=35708 RepID=A0A0A9AL43_ARUDO